MALRNIEVPLYVSRDVDKQRKLTINEFAGRCKLKVTELGVEDVDVSFYFEDMERAWRAVKRF